MVSPSNEQKICLEFSNIFPVAIVISRASPLTAIAPCSLAGDPSSLEARLYSYWKSHSRKKKGHEHCLPRKPVSGEESASEIAVTLATGKGQRA